MRLVFLDSKPLGLLINPNRGPVASRCQQWARGLLAAGVSVVIPEICDYEVRRELIRVGATAGIARLDRLKIGYDYAPITTDIMLRAAELWATARTAGLVTAPPEAIDGDVILAASALLSVGPGDIVTVATHNVRHLAHFVDAQPWEKILP